MKRLLVLRKKLSQQTQVRLELLEIVRRLYVEVRLIANRRDLI